MLYTANLEPSPNSDELCLDAQQADRCSVACKLDQATQRPLLDILSTVGGALPTQSDGGLSHGAVRLPKSGDPAEDALNVTCLNVSTLRKMGRIEICWVKCVGSHLDFDVVHRRLNVFCLPSFCDMNRSKDTYLNLALEDFYKDWNKPAGFTTSQFVQEILLSYKILFASNRRARTIWRQKERKKASQAAGGLNDPLLDDLCGFNGSLTREDRPSYSATSDFPVFAQRLKRIQDDIVRQQPNRLSALWTDRRDPLRWYVPNKDDVAALGVGVKPRPQRWAMVKA